VVLGALEVAFRAGVLKMAEGEGRSGGEPPLVMVGYSSRLALSTTVVGLVFGLSGRTNWESSVALAVPLLAISVFRMSRTATAWADPQVRARVVATVAS
jgi:hypothetical protein